MKKKHPKMEIGGATIGHQPDLAKGLNEAGGMRRNHDVTAHRTAGASARSDTIHGADHGNFDGMQGAHLWV